MQPHSQAYDILTFMIIFQDVKKVKNKVNRNVKSAI